MEINMKSIINKLSEIKEFEVYNSDQYIGLSKCGDEIVFPNDSEHIASRKTIVFFGLDCKKKVLIGLSADIFNSCFFRFEENPFSKEEMTVFSKVFDFDLEPHPFHSEYLMGSFGKINADYSAKCYGAIQKCEDVYYLLIYSSRSSKQASGMANDFFGDNIYYIHCICNVEISVEFSEKVNLNL
jgi:hypothetical protein